FVVIWTGLSLLMSIVTIALTSSSIFTGIQRLLSHAAMDDEEKPNIESSYSKTSKSFGHSQSQQHSEEAGFYTEQQRQEQQPKYDNHHRQSNTLSPPTITKDRAYYLTTVLKLPK